MGNQPKRRTSKVLIQEVQDEVLIYDLERNEVHCLNGSAARVWSLCEGERTVSEIARLVAPDLEPDTAASVVWSALNQFSERHLLEEPEEGAGGADWREGTTRRQLIGLSLAVGLALPLVESIVAPTSAMAQSGATGATG